MAAKQASIYGKEDLGTNTEVVFCRYLEELDFVVQHSCPIVIEKAFGSLFLGARGDIILA